MNIPDERDSGFVYWSTTAKPLAGGVVRSPIIFVGDSPDRSMLDLPNANDVLRQARGPGVDIFCITTVASAGATLQLVGATDPGFTTGVTVWSAAVVAAAGTYQLPALLASAMASAPKTFNSPFPYWKATFNNGATNQNNGWILAIRAGGWA